MGDKSGRAWAIPWSRGRSGWRGSRCRLWAAAPAKPRTRFSSSPRSTPSSMARWTRSRRSSPGPNSRIPPRSRNWRASAVSCWRTAISSRSAEGLNAIARSLPLTVRVNPARRSRIWSNSSKGMARSEPPNVRGVAVKNRSELRPAWPVAGVVIDQESRKCSALGKARSQ